MRRLATHLLVALSLLVLGANVAAAAVYRFSNPTNLGPTINSNETDIHAWVSDDGLRFYFASKRPDGSDLDIYEASLSGGFGTPSLMEDPFSSSDEDFRPFESSDGLNLYYNNRGAAGGPFFVATRSDKSIPWDHPGVTIDSTVFSALTFPSGYATGSVNDISADGSYLVLQGNKGSKHDLFVSPWNGTSGKWDPAQMIDVDGVFGGSGRNIHPSLSSDELAIFFVSNRPGAPGNWDIFALTRPDASTAWTDTGSLSVSLVQGINTSSNDLGPFLRNGVMYFQSDRSGGQGGQDLYRAYVPEPATFVLWALLGLAGLVCYTRRRRQ